MDNSALGLTLAKLKAEYRAQLPRTLEQMEALWSRCVSGEAPPAELKEFARMAHAIAGSGGTFGLAEASRIARELEHRIEALAGRVPAAAEQDAVTALLLELRETAGADAR